MMEFAGGNDRQRLGLALIIATLLHVAVGVGTLFVDFAPDIPQPEFPPVLVRLDPIDPIPEPPPPPPPPPQPVPVPAQPAPQPTLQPAPTPPQPAPTPTQPAPTQAQPRATQPAPTRTAPAQPRVTQPAPAPAPAQPTPSQPAPPAHNIPMQQWDAAALQGTARSDSPRVAPPSPSLAVDEAATAAAAPLPAWASETMASAGISTAGMEQAEVVQVAQRVQSDARFREQLQSAIAAVQSAPATRPATSGSAAGTTTGTQPSGPAVSGQTGTGDIVWADGAGRGGIPRHPRLTADMFGGTVPARTEFVVLFDVGANGSVIPGSIVFQTRSGYTRVNEEVRRTISGWTFQPKPGASVETAIVTLIVFREDVL